MAFKPVEIVQAIMKAIGLGHTYGCYNGSPTCRLIREEAVEKLRSEMDKKGLALFYTWEELLPKAEKADARFGNGYLTNVWRTCSLAIWDAISRQAYGSGLPADPRLFTLPESSRTGKGRKRGTKAGPNKRARCSR